MLCFLLVLFGWALFGWAALVGLAVLPWLALLRYLGWLCRAAIGRGSLGRAAMAEVRFAGLRRK